MRVVEIKQEVQEHWLGNTGFLGLKTLYNGGAENCLATPWDSIEPEKRVSLFPPMLQSFTLEEPEASPFLVLVQRSGIVGRRIRGP